jgi:RNA polymerase sigma-70 factor (ECF subfamily)
MLQQTLQSATISRPGLTPQAESVQPVSTPFDDLDSIVALYEARIFRFLFASLRDRDLALSITQDTFLRAWSARHSFRGDSSINTWLMRIALNLLRDHTRTNRFKFWKSAAATAVDVADVASHIPHPGTSIEARLIASEQLALIWDTVASLSSRQRDIFLLRFVEGIEIPDIAHVTGLPVSTVKSHLYRALATIRTRHSGSAEPTPKATRERKSKGKE